MVDKGMATNVFQVQCSCNQEKASGIGEKVNKMSKKTLPDLLLFRESLINRNTVTLPNWI